MSQFPKPWQPLRGTYRQAAESPRFAYNERDFAKAAAFTAMAQPFVLATCGGLEQIAAMLEPEGLSAGGKLAGHVVRDWAWQTLLVALLRSAVAYLQSNGDQLFLDACAWLWRMFWLAMVWLLGRSLPAGVVGWMRRKAEPAKPEPEPEGWWDRWRERRKRRERWASRKVDQ